MTEIQGAQSKVKHLSSIEQERQNQLIWGLSKNKLSYVFLLTSCCFWVTGFIYGNQNNMDPSESTLSRYTLMVIVSYLHCRKEGSNMLFHNRANTGALLFRTVVYTLHAFVMAYVQFYLPLNVVHTMVIAGQVFIILANYLFKGVAMTKLQMVSSAVSFIGLAFIINGRLLEEKLNPDYEFESNFSHYKTQNTKVLILVGLCYVAWQAMWATAVVLSKLPNYSGAELMFTQSVAGVLICGSSNFFNQNQQPVVYAWSLLYLALPLLVANYLFTYGILWGDNTGVSSLMLMNTILVGYFFSLVKYNQTLNFYSIIGTVILVASVGTAVYLQETRPKSEQKTKKEQNE